MLQISVLISFVLELKNKENGVLTSRVQKLQLLCPQANSRDNGGFGSHPRTAHTLYFGHGPVCWGDDRNILQLVLFVRAVGWVSCLWFSLSTLLFQLASAAAGPTNTFSPVYFAANCEEGISKGLGAGKALFNIVFHFRRKKCPQAWLVKRHRKKKINS